MDKIKAAVIYLASGNSKRFGQENKLLQMIGTKPMYRYGLDRLIDLCKEHEEFEIIVVTQYQEIVKQTQYDPITTVFCPESKYGISWSIKAGIKAAKDAEFYAFFRSRPAKYEKERQSKDFSLLWQMNFVNSAVSEQKKTLGIPYGSQRNINGNCYRFNKRSRWQENSQKHIENARFFKVLEESELCDIDFPKEMQAMLAKQGKSS